MNIICKIHIIRIQIWILFLTPWVTNINKNIICRKCLQIYLNIQIYSKIKKKKNQVPGCCYLLVWRSWIWYQNLLFLSFHTTDKVKYLKKTPPCFVFYYNRWILSVANNLFPEQIQIQIIVIILVYYEYKYNKYL